MKHEEYQRIMGPEVQRVVDLVANSGQHHDHMVHWTHIVREYRLDYIERFGEHNDPGIDQSQEVVRMAFDQKLIKEKKNRGMNPLSECRELFRFEVVDQAA